MADKDKLKEFMELRVFKEEYVAKLEAIGIEDVDDLAEALADEERVKEIHEHLKGVGPKTIEHWREDLGVEPGAEGEDEEEAEPEEEEEAAPKTKKVRKAKAEPEEEAKDKEEEVEIEEEGGYQVKLKPKLSKETIDALKKRAEVDSRRPEFLRQEWHTRKRLQGAKWRRPRGMHSKMRQHYAYRRNVVSIGYGSPKEARYLHPSGFKEVMVHNVKDLARINPETEAARVAHKVGMKKRLEIEAKAEELKIRVLNRSG
ncbi:MAG: ribosomal protein L32e [Candidatus Thermoplasmatota archaeon]|nr:ribosomal protein L32e [Candidatus Thermoplasmatota archaeon]